MDHGEGDLPKERFFTEPDGCGGVLSGAPKDGRVFKLSFNFANDCDALFFLGPGGLYP